jgi:hypothetical protein
VRISQRNKTSIITNNKQSEKAKEKDETILKKEELFESQFEAQQGI